MRTADIPEINNLSIPEKILFIEDLWDSITLVESEVPVPESHINELKKRLKKLESNPGKLLSIEELKGKIETRK
jgi:putative addiction module component (TIGR02574 family)